MQSRAFVEVNSVDHQCFQCEQTGSMHKQCAFYLLLSLETLILNYHSSIKYFVYITCKTLTEQAQRKNSKGVERNKM